MKRPTKRLIIWRSQVQALAGPPKKAVTKFVTAFFVPLRKMKHHLTILHAGITHFKHFMYKQQEESKLKK